VALKGWITPATSSRLIPVGRVIRPLLMFAKRDLFTDGRPL